MNAITVAPARGVLAVPAFRNLLLGGSLSQLGDVCFMVALPWVILQMTGSGIALGSILMAMAIPRAALMLFGGAISDRMPARKVLLIANCVLALSVAAIGLLAAQHLLALWAVYVIAVCFGVADAFANPALKVLIPQVVGREHVQSANSLVQSSTQVCLLGGAPIAGLLIAKYGIVPVFFVDAASYVFLILALLGIADSKRTTDAAASIWRAIAEGVHYVKNDAALRSLILLFACVNFCMTGATQVGLVSVAHFRFASPADFGFMTAAAAIGSLAGIVLAGIWQHKYDFGTTVLLACGMLGAFLLSLALQLPIALMLAALLIAGTIAGYISVYVLSGLQKSVESQMLGRVMSVMAFSSVGVAPISLAVSGYLVQSHPQLVFIFAGAALLSITLAFGACRVNLEISRPGAGA